MREIWVRSLGWEDPLEESITTHPSILAWRILMAEQPGGLQSMGSQSVRHDLATKNSTEQYLIVAFICISLIIDNIECPFMCFFAINIYILVKYLSKSFAHFYWIICFLIIELCKLFLYWLGQKVLLGFSIRC